MPVTGSRFWQTTRAPSVGVAWLFAYDCAPTSLVAEE